MDDLKSLAWKFGWPSASSYDSKAAGARVTHKSTWWCCYHFCQGDLGTKFKVYTFHCRCEAADPQMKHLEQLFYLPQLTEDRILSDKEFIEQKQIIIDTLRKIVWTIFTLSTNINCCSCTCDQILFSSLFFFTFSDQLQTYIYMYSWTGDKNNLLL